MDRTTGDGHRPDGKHRGEGRDGLAQDDHHEATERPDDRADEAVCRRARRVPG